MTENVLVTGFGPFEGYPVNPSWLTVKKLAEQWNFQEKLTIKEIQVSYDDVNKEISKLLATLKPKLVLHIGVSNREKDVIHIEKVANSSGYTKPDINNCCGPNHTECVCLTTNFNVDKIVGQCEKLFPTVKCSTDAGRYLCEYIYYNSLQNMRNVLFVHVPVLNVNVTPEVLAKIVSKIIGYCLEQIDK